MDDQQPCSSYESPCKDLENLREDVVTNDENIGRWERRYSLLGWPQLLTILMFFTNPLLTEGYLKNALENPERMHSIVDYMAPPREQCYSCFSHAYLPMWNVLMLHYFPPYNFTDRCWQPDAQIGTVLCHSACFTIVERVASGPDDFYTDDKQAVMRGCVDRFLLFGLDDDVKTGLMSVDRRHSNICRKSNRKILKMYPLSSENDPVYLCTCIGPRCNEEDMMDRLNGSPFVPPTIPTLLLIAAYRLFNA